MHTSHSLLLCFWLLMKAACAASLDGTTSPASTSTRQSNHTLLQAKRNQGKPVPHASFFNAIAFGQMHPESCLTSSFNPNLRLAAAMIMLLFPIAFYAVYECCCTGDRRPVICQYCRWDKKKRKSSVESVEQGPDISHVGLPAQPVVQ